MQFTSASSFQMFRVYTSVRFVNPPWSYVAPSASCRGSDNLWLIGAGCMHCALALASADLIS